MIKRFWKYHSWFGFYFSLVIAFICLTGALALFKDEIDVLINPSLHKVAIPKNTQKVSLNLTIDNLKKKNPDLKLSEILLPKQENGTWNIRFKDSKATEIYPIYWEIFVNPYDGEILGGRNYYQTFSYFLRNIHVRFFEHFLGRFIIGLAGLSFIILLVSGLVIYRKFIGKRSFWTLRTNKKRSIFSDSHKFIGIITILFQFMIALTGAWLGMQPKLQEWFNIDRPDKYVREQKIMNKEEDESCKVDYDLLIIKAKKEFPEIKIKYLRPSSNGESILTIAGDIPNLPYEHSSNKLIFDKQSNELIFKYNISAASIKDKFYFIQEGLHFGAFGGVGLKIVYFILALSSVFLCISGLSIRHLRLYKSSLTKKYCLWLGGIGVFIAIIALLSMHLSINIPSYIVSALFYGGLFYLLLRFLIISRLIKN